MLAEREDMILLDCFSPTGVSVANFLSVKLNGLDLLHFGRGLRTEIYIFGASRGD